MVGFLVVTCFERALGKTQKGRFMLNLASELPLLAGKKSLRDEPFKPNVWANAPGTLGMVFWLVSLL